MPTAVSNEPKEKFDWPKIRQDLHLGSLSRPPLELNKRSTLHKIREDHPHLDSLLRHIFDEQKPTIEQQIGQSLRLMPKVWVKTLKTIGMLVGGAGIVLSVGELQHDVPYASESYLALIGAGLVLGIYKDDLIKHQARRRAYTVLDLVGRGLEQEKSITPDFSITTFREVDSFLRTFGL